MAHNTGQVAISVRVTCQITTQSTGENHCQVSRKM